jgi:hypothetical protein
MMGAVNCQILNAGSFSLPSSAFLLQRYHDVLLLTAAVGITHSLQRETALSEG